MKRKYTKEEVWERMTGRMYFNPNDKNIFVKRKTSFSWTMNYGNKWSWLITALELAAVVLFVRIFFKGYFAEK